MNKKTAKVTDLPVIRDRWAAAWPEAVKIWNPYVTLREPEWCMSQKMAEKEGLTGSFAMIRLTDHRIVIDIATVQDYRVEDFALQVLAHEIGHHVLIPANNYDNAGLFKRIRIALAGIENRAPLVSNLYSDLIINDALQRTMHLDMAAVYKHLQETCPVTSKLHIWYMRTYEYLWSLPRGSVSGPQQLPQIDADASLAASVIRSYARNWLDGAGRFALLAYPYLIEEKEHQQARNELARYLDAEKSSEGSDIPGGMAEIDDQILEGIVDPRSEAIASYEGKGEAETDLPEKPGKPEISKLRSITGGTGPQQRYQQPGVYIDMMKQVDPSADENKLVNRYYRDIALPYLVPFPTDTTEPLAELLPEGTDPWEPGDPIEELDWFETALVSPVIVPGITTRSRVFSVDYDTPEKEQPFNLYVGIDCSGSMNNPRINFSWPICAGTIVSLSALRAGARVMSCLSGEPGLFLETPGFIKSENDVLTVLTSYLGTGYAYGIPRLKTPHLENIKGKTHLLIVSDDDIFSMLQAKDTDGRANYEIAEQALERAGGGGTFVLHSRPGWHQGDVERLQKMGWVVHYVTAESEMLDFARAFADRFYRRKGRKP